MNNRCKQVLVVGGTGFIGSKVAGELIRLGHDVAIGARSVPERRIDSCEYLALDLSNPTTYADVLAQFEVIVCLASASLPATSNTSIPDEIEAHVMPVVKLAEMCARAGVYRFLFGSSGGTIYGPETDFPSKEDDRPDPISGYGASKLAIEQYLRVLANEHSNFEICSLRIGNPYGRGQKLKPGHGLIPAAIRACREDEILTVYGDGSLTRDYVWIDDVSSAFAKAIVYDGPITRFNIGTGVGYTVGEIIEIVELAFGKELRAVNVAARSADVPISILDPSLARAELNWVPTVSVPEGITMLAAEAHPD